MKVRTLFNKIFPPLRKSEQSILYAIVDNLNDEGAKLLTDQIESINYVQRHADGKEVNLYCMRGNKAKFNEDILFPSELQEFKMASVHLRQANGRLFTADIWVCNGHIFSIEYSVAPPKTSADNLKILDVTILTDPMLKNKEDWIKGEVHSWISDKLHGNVYVRPPLDEGSYADNLNNILSYLPSDYIDIIKMNNGIRSESIIILGSDRLRKVDIQGNEYTVFAEIPDKGVIAVRHNNKGVWLIDFENYLEQKLGETFKDALKHV